MDTNILKGLVFPMELKEATLSVPVSDELYKKVHSRKPDDWYDGFAEAVNTMNKNTEKYYKMLILKKKQYER